MLIDTVAFVFTNVLIAEKAIAFVTLGADRVVAKRRPIFSMNMVRDRDIAGVKFRMHAKTFPKARKAYRIFRPSRARSGVIALMPRLPNYFSSEMTFFSGLLFQWRE